MFLFEKRLTRRHGGARFAKCVRYLCVLFLFASFLVVGCKEDQGDDFSFELDKNLIGTWTSTFDDSYVITDTHLTYDDGYGGGYAGTIRYAVSSGTAGVIIFEYDADKKPEYQDYDSNWQPVGDPYPPPGNFIGVYYKDLKPGESVQMGTAYIAGGAEEKTLDAAVKAFTVDKEGDYMSMYGAYTK